MRIGMIGLGKMGGNMTARLLRGGQEVVAYDLTPANVKSVQDMGAIPALDLDALISNLAAPRAVWIMVPAGAPTESTIQLLVDRLSPGDIIIDGGNSKWTDSQRRAEMLKDKGLNFVDVGTSGGIWGLTEGYCMMVGGDTQVVESLRPIFEALAPAPSKGWGHVGPSGAGHYTKMVHNGIEYGMMQALAEGFELMRARHELVGDVSQVADIWRTGSVIRSWLLDLTADALLGNPALDELSDYVADSGEGRWTVQDAVELGVPVPVIAASVQTRFYTQQPVSYAGKMLSAMRRAFGGHAVKTIQQPKVEGHVPEVDPLATPGEASTPAGLKGEKQ
nr:decarboxylating 6-phosphogluconate dehydrogenase [Deinococcus yavapaiensis]